jgi:hypothetical protein
VFKYVFGDTFVCKDDFNAAVLLRAAVISGLYEFIRSKCVDK